MFVALIKFNLLSSPRSFRAFYLVLSFLFAWFLLEATLGSLKSGHYLAATSLPNSRTVSKLQNQSDLIENHVQPNPYQAPISQSLREWEFGCNDRRRVIVTGTGMGGEGMITNSQTVNLPEPEDVVWLQGQVAGSLLDGGNVPDEVVFSDNLGNKTIRNIPVASTNAYYFATELVTPTNAPSASISASVLPSDTEVLKTLRGFILYSAYNSGDELWASFGRLTNAYVFEEEQGTHSEVLSFLPLIEPTDLTVTAVVIDNNDNDGRSMLVETEAGGVSTSTTALSSTDGPLLNIVTLTLPNVPTDTTSVTITLTSPQSEGDSLILSGINVAHKCKSVIKPEGLFLPVIMNTADLLRVFVESEPRTVYVGGDMRYTVTVSNISDIVVKDVSLTINLDANAVFQSFTPPRTNCTFPPKIVCYWPKIDSGQFQDIVVNIQPLTSKIVTKSVTGKQFGDHITVTGIVTSPMPENDLQNNMFNLKNFIAHCITSPNNTITDARNLGPVLLAGIEYCGWQDDALDYYQFETNNAGIINITAQAMGTPTNNLLAQKTSTGTTINNNWCCTFPNDPVAIDWYSNVITKQFFLVNSLDIAPVSYVFSIDLSPVTTTQNSNILQNSSSRFISNSASSNNYSPFIILLVFGSFSAIHIINKKIRNRHSQQEEHKYNKAGEKALE